MKLTTIFLIMTYLIFQTMQAGNGDSKFRRTEPYNDPFISKKPRPKVVNNNLHNQSTGSAKQKLLPSNPNSNSGNGKEPVS